MTQGLSPATRITGFWLLLLTVRSLPPAFCVPSALPQTPTADPFQQGLLALKQNRLDLALEQLSFAEQERPADAKVRNFRGIVLARLGRATEAEAEYLESIRLDPNTSDAYRNLGYLSWMEHRLHEARESLRTALRLAPDDVFAHYYLGRVELDAKNYPKAFQELVRSRAAWPDDPEFLLDAATGYLALQREDGARNVLDRLQTLPLTGEQSIRLGSLLLSAHDNDSALKLFRNLNQKHEAWAQLDLALAYLLTGRYQEAAGQARSIVGEFRSIPPPSEPISTVKAATLLGIAYARLGENDKALEAFYWAALLAPQQEERWLDLTRELMAVGNYDEAISQVQRGITQVPQSYVLRLRLGAAFLKSGRYTQAEAVFRDLIAHGEPLATSYAGLSQVLLRTGRPEEAASELATAQKKLGTSFLLAYFQGIALERAARPQESIAAFHEAVRLNPQSAEAHLGLGRVELNEKQIQPAISELNEVLRLDTKSRQARALLSQAYRLAGNAKSALEYAEPVEQGPPPAPEGDLVGDFFVPGWEWPPRKQ